MNCYMYEHFHLWAYIWAFLHFEYNVYNLKLSGTPYLCSFTPHKSRPSEGNHQAIAIKDNFCQLTILISVANTSTGDTHVTTCCCLSMCSHKWLGAMCSTAHTPAQSCSVTTQLLKNYPLNRTLVHGACVKAGLHARLTRSAEMQAKRGRP